MPGGSPVLIGRTRREHAAFGRGVHSCPGAPLVRADARVTLERFLAHRVRDIRISDAEHEAPG